MAVAAITSLACVAVAVLFEAAPLASVALGAAAGWLCANYDSRYGVAAIATGALAALFTAPHLIQMLVEQYNRVPEIASTAALLAAAAGFALLVVALVRRRRPAAALTAAVIGIFTLPQLATAMLVLIADSERLGNPWQAYWVSMLPYGRWTEARHAEYVFSLFDALIWYPALFTTCATFALTFCFRATDQALRLPQ